MFYERLTAFLKEYVAIPSDMLDKNGLLTNEYYIRCVICFLLKGDIFTKDELRRTAAKEYRIILPLYYFDEG